MPRSAAIAELLAVFAPPTCAACAEPLPRAEILVCGACLRELPWLQGWRCPRCALPRHSSRGCPARGAAFTTAWAPLAYDGTARSLVAALKFRGALALAELMAAQITAHLPAHLRSPTPALVPVPPHPVRRRRRGFDPAAALTAALASRTGMAQAAILRRRDRAPRQVGLGRAQRRRPGRLIVEATSAPPARVLLIDDVHTTGATLDACARELVAAGCREVAGVTYARAL